MPDPAYRAPWDIPNRQKIVRVAEMQQIEKSADAAGHSYRQMMESAGRSVAVLARSYADQEDPKVIVLAGPGNNGGDGLVCARYLQQAGIDVYVYVWKRVTDQDEHLGRLREANVPVVHARDDPQLEQLTDWLMNRDIVIDSLLGTGSNRPIEGILGQILDVMKEIQEIHPHVTVAVDCPSGLNCDTGEIDPHTAPADLTVTFAYAKRGHYLFPGTSACGEIVVADIGTPPNLADEIAHFCLTTEWVHQFLPERTNNSHKGTFGKAMAAVGCLNYPGAAYLSCAAMGRVGAGLVTGAIADPVWSPVATKLTEATWLVLPTEDGAIAEEGAALLVEKAAGYTALLVGCGLGQAPGTQRFIEQLLTHKSLPPLVVDADGLNLLARIPQWWEKLQTRTLLTPHAAEMSRLCGVSVEEIQANRWDLAQQKAKEWNAIILVKGPYTVIADPDGTLAILPVATPALATAGTGDVLAGTITGLIAQGVDPFAAACLGSWLHGKAGEKCADTIGLAGTMASDVLNQIPSVMQELRAI